MQEILMVQIKSLILFNILIKYLDIDSIISRVLIENLKTNSQFIFYLQTIDYSKVKSKTLFQFEHFYFLIN
jgi:hypothetical protein